MKYAAGGRQTGTEALALPHGAGAGRGRLGGHVVPGMNGMTSSKPKPNARSRRPCVLSMHDEKHLRERGAASWARRYVMKRKLGRSSSWRW